MGAERMAIFFVVVFLVLCIFPCRGIEDVPCGGVVQVTYGDQLDLPSLKYPVKKGPCGWKFVADESLSLALLIYAIQYPRNSKEHYFISREKPNVNGSLTYGSLAGSLIRSEGNTIYLDYYAPSYSAEDKFTILFFQTAVPGRKCGGEVDVSRTGTLYAPGVWNVTERTTTCFWKFKSKEDKKMEMNFFYFQMDLDCEKEYLKLYPNPDDKPHEFTRYCASKGPGVYISPTNVIGVEYYSNILGYFAGFGMKFKPVS
ncbi:unnamed protein product [Calicophoron daubneyi]|uniref:CUB domain-containing protein n=1 Tax=Calicophoron daubneyi TaxID=300641 RepID=A0AAV2TEP6_CALDB